MREDPKITAEMQAYLNAPKEERDHEKGAMLLLRISGNRIQYASIMRRGAEASADLIEHRLRQYLDFRMARLTHREVREMEVKATEAVANSRRDEKSYREGRRKDHDSLPPEIQALYAETLDCVNKERELHMQIRNLALRQATCPDSEVYPFVKEILKIDDRRLQCWEAYDSYKAE